MQIQTVTLGGVPLPSESRSLSGFQSQIISTQGRAADGTLHEDFRGRKKTWTIAYKVVSESTKTLIEGIEADQVNNAAFPTLTYTDENGIAQSFTVRVSVGNFGPLIPQNSFYYNGVTITAVEV